MSELVTIVLYLLICKELKEPAIFPGNEFFWNTVNDHTYAPLLADLSVWAATEDRCKEEAFNAVNGDVFVWKYAYKDLADQLNVKVRLFYLLGIECY